MNAVGDSRSSLSRVVFDSNRMDGGCRGTVTMSFDQLGGFLVVRACVNISFAL